MERGSGRTTEQLELLLQMTDTPGLILFVCHNHRGCKYAFSLFVDKIAAGHPMKIIAHSFTIEFTQSNAAVRFINFSQGPRRYLLGLSHTSLIFDHFVSASLSTNRDWERYREWKYWAGLLNVHNVRHQ